MRFGLGGGWWGLCPHTRNVGLKASKCRPLGLPRAAPHDRCGKKLSQCAARRTRHRAFLFANLAAEHSYLYVFVQASLSRSAANNNAKNEQFCNRLSRFCDVKIHKNESKRITNRPKIGSGAVPGALGGDLGTILVPGWPKA